MVVLKVSSALSFIVHALFMMVLENNIFVGEENCNQFISNHGPTTIRGTGVGETIIDCAGFPGFRIQSTAPVYFEDLTIQNAEADQVCTALDLPCVCIKCSYMLN